MHVVEVDASDELLEGIAYLHQNSDQEVRLCLTDDARLASTRFNFQLLQYHAAVIAKWVVIVSVNPGIQRMARECGLIALNSIHDQLPVEVATALQSASGTAPPRIDAIPPGAEVATPSVVPPARWYRQPRWLLAGGGSLLILLGLVLGFSSATIILVAEAQPLASPIQVESAPGSSSIPVRTQSSQKTVSASFPVSSVKNMSSVPARGEVVFRNDCSVNFRLLPGQEVGTGSGVVFVLDSGSSRLKRGDNATFSVHAVQPGAGGNVGAGQITSIANVGQQGSCLTVSNPDPTEGGSDEQHQTFFSPSDLQIARNTLEQQAQKQITDELNGGVKSGEKLSSTINYQPADFKADHQPGDQVKSFGATLNLTGEGAYYRPDDVDHAFANQFGSKAGNGQQLVDQGFKSDYQVTG
ncbi:MAG: baseplate J/gp47 family protein, partial [Candidatus Dormibacteraceae bacterium]